MTDAELLGLHLAARDTPCPACGYNLRGINSPLCPECAQPLLLRVGLVRSSTAAYLTALMPPVAVGGAGLCLALCCLAVTAYKGQLPPRPEQTFLLWCPLGLGLALATWVFFLSNAKGRHWFRRLTRGRQRLVAAASCTVTMLAFLAWAVVVLTAL